MCNICKTRYHTEIAAQPTRSQPDPRPGRNKSPSPEPATPRCRCDGRSPNRSRPDSVPTRTATVMAGQKDVASRKHLTAGLSRTIRFVRARRIRAIWRRGWCRITVSRATTSQGEPPFPDLRLVQTFPSQHHGLFPPRRSLVLCDYPRPILRGERPTRRA